MKADLIQITLVLASLGLNIWRPDIQPHAADVWIVGALIIWALKK